MREKNKKRFWVWLLVFSLVLSTAPLNSPVYVLAGNKI